MQKAPKTSLVVRLVAHLGMGITLGIIFGLCLVHFNIANISAIIQNTFDPGATLAEFIGSIVLDFGIGATLTGFIFMEMDRSRSDNP